MDYDRSDIMMTLGGELNALMASFRTVVANSAEHFHADLQPAAYQIAVMLSLSGPSKAGSLAKKLGMDKSAVSRLVKSLCGTGLATASSDPEDGRGIVYSLTDQGDDRVRAANVIKSDAYFSRIKGWSVDEMAQFAHLLKKFNKL